LAACRPASPPVPGRCARARPGHARDPERRCADRPCADLGALSRRVVAWGSTRTLRTAAPRRRTGGQSGQRSRRDAPDRRSPGRPGRVLAGPVRARGRARSQRVSDRPDRAQPHQRAGSPCRRVARRPPRASAVTRRRSRPRARGRGFAIVAQRDDHEPTTTGAGQLLDDERDRVERDAPALSARARQAMLEWTPVPAGPVHRVIDDGPLLDGRARYRVELRAAREPAPRAQRAAIAPPIGRPVRLTLARVVGGVAVTRRGRLA